MRTFVAAIVLLFSAHAAHAADVTVNFTGTVSNAFGTISGISSGEPITGSFHYESTTSGSFTPAGNPMFERSIMLYSGAITSFEITLVSDTASGTTGDTKLLDSTDMFAGDDSYEVTATLSSGTISGAAAESIFFNPNYPFTTYTLADGDPLPPPPPPDGGAFHQFNLTVTDGSAYGAIDSFEVIMEPDLVPGLSLVGMLVLVASLVIAAGLAMRFLGRT